MSKDYDEDAELTAEELEKVTGGLGALKRFSAREKGLLVRKGNKFKVVEDGRELEVKMVVAYNGSVFEPDT
jgi:hypothetical protein